MNRLITKPEAKLIATFKSALLAWSTALALEFNCCDKHNLVATTKVLNQVERFSEVALQYSNYRISTAQMEYLINVLIEEMTTEARTLLGLHRLDEAMKSALVQKEARA